MKVDLRHARGCLCELCHALMLGMPGYGLGFSGPGHAWIQGYYDAMDWPGRPITPSSEANYSGYVEAGRAAARRAKAVENEIELKFA